MLTKTRCVCVCVCVCVCTYDVVLSKTAFTVQTCFFWIERTNFSLSTYACLHNENRGNTGENVVCLNDNAINLRYVLALKAYRTETLAVKLLNRPILL